MPVFLRSLTVSFCIFFTLATLVTGYWPLAILGFVALVATFGEMIREVSGRTVLEHLAEMRDELVAWLTEEHEREARRQGR